MNQNLNLTNKKEILLEEKNFLENENVRLETIINSQTKRDKNEERLKKINEELMEMHVKLLKTEENNSKVRK